MEITVMTKTKYDALIAQIKNLETQTAMLHGQIKAIQDSNNQLAEIAFDESRFTDKLLEKVDDLARESARDTIDIDDIANEVANNLDVSEEVERCAERLGYVCEDKVNDLIRDHIDDEGIPTMSEVEQAIQDYLEQNDYADRSVVEDVVYQEIKAMKQEIIDAVVQTLINKLTAKENDHATGNHDYSLSLPRVANESQAEGNGQAAA